MKKFILTTLLSISFFLLSPLSFLVTASATTTAQATPTAKAPLSVSALPTATTSTPTASSENSYACILVDDTYFYETESDLSVLFTLPKTYFVKVLSQGERFTKVEYQTNGLHTQPIVGYCQTHQLTFVDFIPVNPYLYATFEVNYTAENADDGDNFLEKLTFTCAYYGDYIMGIKQYAYVLRDGEYVYVPKPQNFRYAENTEYAEYIASQTENGIQNSEATPIQIGFLVVLCLLVPLLSALIIKSSKSPYPDIEDA